MDDAELRRRLWEGFAALQTLLGGSARDGFVIETPGLVASIVPSAPDSPALNAAVAIDRGPALSPSAPDSPALNAAVAIDPRPAPASLEELDVRYGDAGIRRWAIWVD